MINDLQKCTAVLYGHVMWTTALSSAGTDIEYILSDIDK